MPDGSVKPFIDKQKIFYADIVKYHLEQELNDYIEECIKDLEKKRETNRTGFSSGNLMMQEAAANNNTRYVTTAKSLSLPITISDYNNCDTTFFNWWAIDDAGAIFMKTHEGYVRVPFIEGARKAIANDNNFWTLFWKEHHADFKVYDKSLTTIAWDFYENDVEEVDNMSFLDKVHNEIPKAILDATGIQIVHMYEKFETPEGTVTTKTLKNIELVAKSSVNSFMTASEQNLAQALSQYMLMQVDEGRLPKMSYFSNNYGASMFRLNIEAYKKTPFNAKMPSQWEDFFSTALVNKPLSQRYRLAKWVSMALDSSNTSRQALLLTGKGQDGKSLFVETLTRGLNDKFLKRREKFVMPCSPNGLSDGNTQNGLINCLDSHIITIADISKTKDVIESTFFKAVTGGDTFQCQKKYANPIEKNMNGTKVILTTNHATYLSNAYSITRIVPIYFTPKAEGFKFRSNVEMQKELLSQFDEFIGWCFAYAAKFDGAFDLPKNMIAMTDIDEMVANKSKERTDEKSAYEGIYGTDECLVKYKAADEYAEEDDIEFERFVNDMFIVSDGAVLPYYEIFQLWDVYVQDATHRYLQSTYKMQPKTNDSRNFKQFLIEHYHVKFASRRLNGQMTRVIVGLTRAAN